MTISKTCFLRLIGEFLHILYNCIYMYITYSYNLPSSVHESLNQLLPNAALCIPQIHRCGDPCMWFHQLSSLSWVKKSTSPSPPVNQHRYKNWHYGIADLPFAYLNSDFPVCYLGLQDGRVHEHLPISIIFWWPSHDIKSHHPWVPGGSSHSLCGSPESLVIGSAYQKKWFIHGCPIDLNLYRSC